MAYDKVVDSAALDTQLTSIAAAIRAKTGGADSLVFPDGFAEAIAAIEAGGGGGGAGFATGTLTFNESQSLYSDLTVTHNLGFAPDHILWFIIETEAKSSDKLYANNYPASFEYISKEAYLINNNSSAGSSSSKTSTLNYKIMTSGGYLDVINSAGSNEETIKLFFMDGWRYSSRIPASSTIRWLVW